MATQHVHYDKAYPACCVKPRIAALIYYHCTGVYYLFPKTEKHNKKHRTPENPPQLLGSSFYDLPTYYYLIENTHILRIPHGMLQQNMDTRQAEKNIPIFFFFG